VIHTVGPVWRGGHEGEGEHLASCYRRCLELAQAHGLRSLAFPGISTGIYGYPVEAAARIAVETVRSTLPACPGLEEILFCCFSKEALACHQAQLEAAGPTP
jgi:O-acetyl-ADP-ribose deacetylase (regulator of RNase III)